MALPPEADPSGFLERAPALASLLPDEALAEALARGDASVLYRALVSRLAVEPSGLNRDTLAGLVSDRALFAMAEPPPSVRSVLGTGTGFVGAPREDAPEAPFPATRVVRLLGLPVWPLSEHLVRRGGEGTLQVLGGLPRSVGFHARRWASAAALVAVGLGLPGLVGAALLTREVHLVNGLSQPVRVCVDGHCQVLQPEQVVRDSRFSLRGAYRVEASWPGVSAPFETVALPTWERAVYLVLGAAPAHAWPTLWASSSDAPRALGGTDFLSDVEELVVRRGGWRAAFQEYADDGRWPQAGALAEAVAFADPTALEARELAARARLRVKDVLAAARFGEQLVVRYPEDLSAHRLHQDLLLAAGRRQEAYQRYAELIASNPQSVELALLRARLAEPEEREGAVGAVRARFPDAPAPVRELARVLFAKGLLDAGQALPLLDGAREKAPESLEDLELRVRILVQRNRIPEASNAVRLHGRDAKHHSWDFAVLAGRLARTAGPDRTQYITRDFLPADASASEEKLGNADTAQKRSLRFELSAGDGTVKEKELQALAPGPTREALFLTRAVLTDLKQALQLAGKAPDSVLSLLEPDAAAVLALEFFRTQRPQEADRVFGASLPLLLGREALEGYVRTGESSGRFQLLAPGLRAAAHLVRARERGGWEAQREYELARAADTLQGFAVRALDTWQDPRAERVPSIHPAYTQEPHRPVIIHMLRGDGTWVDGDGKPVKRAQ